MRLTPPLKWPGGKHYLAKRIIELMPPHLHYVEPYFGSGAVLLQRDPSRDWFSTGSKLPAHQKGCSEVVNDINDHLTNFWQVLQHPVRFDQFTRLCQATPFSEREYRKAAASWRSLSSCRTGTGGLYAHEMGVNDHAVLLARLGGIKGKFLLSGYHCEVYDLAAKKFGWNCVDIEIDNKLAGGKKKAKEIECVWRNF